MAILGIDDYSEIRAAILSDLEEHDLPDSLVGLDIYVGRAEAEIVERDPDAASRTGADGNRVRRATIYLAAALLCPAIERKTRVQIQTRDVSYSRASFDARVRAAELRGMADDELAQVLTGSSPTRPTMFARAPGTRGK